MCPERQQHNISARSHAPPISLPTTANGLQTLRTTSLIDIYEGTLHAALLPHVFGQPVSLLIPLHHWWLYHRRFIKANGGLLGLHEPCLLMGVIDEMTLSSPSNPFHPNEPIVALWVALWLVC